MPFPQRCLFKIRLQYSFICFIFLVLRSNPWQESDFHSSPSGSFGNAFPGSYSTAWTCVCTSGSCAGEYERTREIDQHNHWLSLLFFSFLLFFQYWAAPIHLSPDLMSFRKFSSQLFSESPSWECVFGVLTCESENLIFLVCLGLPLATAISIAGGILYQRGLFLWFLALQ